MTRPENPKSTPLLQRPAAVLVVVGTRPEAIKMAPVLGALRARRPRIECRLALTGQHSDLVDEALSTFGLVPDWDLEIMRDGQSPSDVGRGCLEGMDRVVREWPPDLVLVQGDTASVFFSALVAYFHGIPAGHVEAGLRTGDLRNPFPEEGFRRMTGVLADLHFAPTGRARENLLREGVPSERIHVTGNTVVDALLEVAARGGPAVSPELRALLEAKTPFLLLTAHRRETFGPPLERVFGAVARLAEGGPAIDILFPVHPNPNVTEPARRILGGLGRVHLVPPLSYGDLVLAMKHARGVLTDSGGVQEEAPTFGTPVLVLREVSERPEGVDAGIARIVGTDPDRIVREATALLRGKAPPRGPAGGHPNPYGDGRAGERIAGIVEEFLVGRA
jgi:UDP-N-acetylglucosamine 2-epimerase (non-hydrolysing)